MLFPPKTLPTAAWHEGWDQADWDRYLERLKSELIVLLALICVRISI